MFEKLFSSIKDFILAGELTRLNTADVRELRKRNEEISLLVERMAHELQRLRENEAHEREKLMLRVEKLLLAQQNVTTKTTPKQLKKKN